METVTRCQMVSPAKLKELVLQEMHCEMGHLGVDRVVNAIRERFFWPSPNKDVNHFITKICWCLKGKRPNKKTRTSLTTVTTTKLEKSSGGYEYILVVIDHFIQALHKLTQPLTVWEDCG